MPFEAGNKAGGRSKGAKNKTTLAKELIQNNLWDEVSGWVTGEGVQKCKEEMMTLEGKDFVYSYMQFLEYFKPKLQRTTLDGKVEIDAFEITIDGENPHTDNQPE